MEGGRQVHAVRRHPAHIHQDRRIGIDEVEGGDVEQPVVEVHMVIVQLAVNAGQDVAVDLPA